MKQGSDGLRSRLFELKAGKPSFLENLSSQQIECPLGSQLFERLAIRGKKELFHHGF